MSVYHKETLTKSQEQTCNPDLFRSQNQDIPHLLEHKIHLTLSLSLLSVISTPATPNSPSLSPDSQTTITIIHSCVMM